MGGNMRKKVFNIISIVYKPYILVYIKQNEKKITGKDNRDLILNAAI